MTDIGAKDAIELRLKPIQKVFATLLNCEIHDVSIDLVQKSTCKYYVASLQSQCSKGHFESLAL